MRGKRMIVIGASITALAAMAAVPALAGDDVASEAASRGGAVISDALDGLVEDGVLSRQQASQVERAIRDAVEDARPFWPRQDAPPGLATAADAIGIEADALVEELRSGATIAEVAGSNGVDVEDVVAAMTVEAQTRLEHAVEEGLPTQERADALRQGIEQRIEALVNGDVGMGGPAFGPCFRGGLHGGFGPPSGEPNGSIPA